MEEKINFKSHKILFFNTLAFTFCFGTWMINGVLVTYLIENQVFNWGPIEIGWLMGIPVLTGSIFRLPVGILTDKYGGKPVFTALLLLCAIPLFLLSQVNSLLGFILCSFGFGLAGTGFAVGIAFTSVWYPPKWQGTALGIFGAGNAGAGFTTMVGPSMLNYMTENGSNIEGWRNFPIFYAVAMIVIAILFFVFTENKKPTNNNKNLKQLLHPLKSMRVWRFGLYYFLVFGCFVAFSQWLVPYFVNVYALSLVLAGLLTSLFSIPSGVIRAAGGWLSDKFGARRVMYWVLGTSIVFSIMLCVPKMDVYSPGKGLMAKKSGVVSTVTDTLIVAGKLEYQISPKNNHFENLDSETLILPTKDMWQTPVVSVGDTVKRNQLLAKGNTRIYFPANVWIFTLLVLFIGISWGIGKAAVYKHIPNYFPEEVGVVGGMVGVLGGLGGFFCPILFGYLLEWTGLWTSSWMLMLFISAISLLWMHHVIKKNRISQTTKQKE
jgi:NNP family nitrate/nitrite transporter-like MFS transporter